MTFQMGNGATSNGFDGTVAWIQAANGVVTEATGVTNAPLPPLARVKRNADFYEPLNLKQHRAKHQEDERGLKPRDYILELHSTP